jgi:hypothetical protein
MCHREEGLCPARPKRKTRGVWCIEPHQRMTTVEGLQMKAHTKWMAESLSKDANRSGVFCEYKAERQQFLDKEIRTFMCGNGWDKVFTRGVRGTHTDTDFRNVWSMQHWMAEELVLGFRIADVPGIDLKH